MTFQQVTADLLVGFLQNCKLFALTLVMAVPLGFVITFGSRAKFAPLKWLTRTFVWIIRGTPLMLQLFVVFYVPGIVFGTPMHDRMLAAVVTFVINYACYFSEIYRGGIDSIPAGQNEAGQVLGMTKSQIFFKIVLQQLIKRIVPPMGNEIITLVKDTSLARVISVSEMLVAAERFLGRGLIWPLFYTGVFFLIFNGVLTILLHYVEKKLDYYRG